MLTPDLILVIAQQAGLKLKRVGPNEHAVRCPNQEAHRNGDAHASCRVNDQKGVFHCDVCGIGGGVVEFAKLLGVDLPPLESTRSGGPAAKSPRGSKRRLLLTADGPISQPLQASFGKSLGKPYAPRTWAAFGVLEGKVYPEDLPEKAEPAVGFPLPGGGHHLHRYRRADRTKRWCFTDGGRAELLIAGLDRSGPILLAEGEWDAMRAYDDGYAVATGTGGASTWKQAWSAQLRDIGRTVIIVYDVDPAGRAGVSKIRAVLRAVGVSATVLELPLSGTPDDKDLSDYRRKHSADEFRALVEALLPSAGFAGLDVEEVSLAPAIDAILCAPLPARLKRREAANLIIDDLLKQGSLIRASGGRLYWFDKPHHRLHDLHAFPFRSSLMQRYQVNPAEPEFKHIMEAVWAAVASRGDQVEVYRVCYYDRRTNRLYLAAGQGRVVRLDGHTPAWIENGVDGVLFDQDDALEIIPREAASITLTDDPLDKYILGRVNFVRGAAVVLSPEQQRLILRVWILSIFFSELLPAKVLLLFYGDKGSGKTTALRVILKLLVGPQANVTPLGKEDGFNATVSQEFLIVFDNVDSFCRWIEDRLATVSTGQTIKLRKLYTTNQMLAFPTRCCIALTARTPRFRRDDVVDRLQILRVARLEKFSRETTWYAEIEQHRVELWAQLLGDLNGVVARLGGDPIQVPDEIRMADWGFVAMTIGESLGRGEDAREALEASELDKAQFLLEADEVYDFLHAIAHDRPDQRWKAGELFAELGRRTEAATIEFTIKSPKSLGRILHRIEPALKRMIRFEITNDLHDGQATYTLGPLPLPHPERGLLLPNAEGGLFPNPPKDGPFHDPDF